MNIVFLTLGYPKNAHDKSLYTDLMQAFVMQGHNVTVFRQNENYKGVSSENVNGVNVIDVYTGKITKVSLIKKGINLLLIKNRFMQAIKTKVPSEIDVLLYSTPPITFAGLISKIQRKYGCINYLLLKDIFPQNAVDLEMFGKKSPFYLYFRMMEKKLYRNSNLIGCMSPANVEYVLSHNNISSGKVHVSPNCILPEEKRVKSDQFSSKFKLIYGGNLGKPQGIDFLLDCIAEIEKREDVELSIVGSGTECNKIYSFISDNKIEKTKLYSFMPNEDYRKLLKSNDMGLILLDKRFTIPNFPSRVLDYFNSGLPIFAITDEICDVKKEICEEGAGIWSLAGDITGFNKQLDYVISNRDKVVAMSLMAYKIVSTKYNAANEAMRIIERCKKEL